MIGTEKREACLNVFLQLPCHAGLNNHKALPFSLTGFVDPGMFEKMICINVLMV